MDKFRASLSASKNRSPIQTETIKYLIQYLLMLVASAVGGGAFSFFLGRESYISSFYQIYTHFTLPFYNCDGAGEVASMLLKYASPKLIAAGIIFLFSFSALNHLATQAILVIEGFKFGFSATLFCRMLGLAEIREYISPYLCVLYVLASLLLLFLLLQYSVDLAKASIAIRRYTPDGRPIFSGGALARMFGLFFRYCVVALVIHSLYCMIIFFVNKG